MLGLAVPAAYALAIKPVRKWTDVLFFFLSTKMLPPVADMDLPGFRLHPLKGELKGFWAVTVRANWRVIFHFADREASDVDYVDYH